MWRCPDCSRSFASAGQVHSCRQLGSLDDHLADVEQNVRATFERFSAEVEALGPVEVLAQKTRIAFHARMTFAVLVPRRRWMNGHLVLARRLDGPPFNRITTYSPRNHVHEFRLAGPGDIDEFLRARIAEAYEVGMQRHHERGSN